MKEELVKLLAGVKEGSVVFTDVIQFIDSRYMHQPAAFKNGDTFNEATQNQGSARVFAFAQLNGLGAAETLLLFAEHYRSVLEHAGGTDHQNIRQFMTHGWAGVQFEQQALTPRG